MDSKKNEDHTAPEAPLVDVHKLYPSRARVFRHTLATIFRVTTFGIILTYLIRPLVLLADSYISEDIPHPIRLVMLTAPVYSIAALLYISYYAVVGHLNLYESYKIERTPRMMPSRALIQRALRQLLVFHLGPRIVLSYLLFCVIPVRGLHDPRYPNAVEMWIGFTIQVVAGEVFAYWSHRLQHEIPFLYKSHKVHHEFKANMAFNAQHFSFFEITFNTVMQHLSFRNSTIEMSIVGILWRSMEEYEAHSGYSFRDSWLSQRLGILKSYHSEFHDFHHSQNVGNYGYNLFMDYWLKTADAYVLHQSRLKKGVFD